MGISSRINLQLAPEQFKFIAETSQKNGINKTQLLRNIVQQYINAEEEYLAYVEEQIRMCEENNY